MFHPNERIEAIVCALSTMHKLNHTRSSDPFHRHCLFLTADYYSHLIHIFCAQKCDYKRGACKQSEKLAGVVGLAGRTSRSHPPFFHIHTHTVALIKNALSTHTTHRAALFCKRERVNWFARMNGCINSHFRAIS